MRLFRLLSPLFGALFLIPAAGALHAQTLLSLGTGTNCGTLSAGQQCTLTARVTNLPPGASGALTWSISPALGSLASTSTTPGSNGNHTNTYTAPASIASKQTVTVIVTASDGTSASQELSLVPPTVTVRVTPASATLTPGQTQQFTASILGVSQTAVTWSISPQVGTLSVNGNTATYTAPSSVSASQKITLTATSAADSTASGAATITVNPLISIGSGAPTETLTIAFQSAYRGAFAAATVLPPAGNVKAFGSNGYVQEFTDAANSSAKDALVTGSPALGTVIYQIMAPLYAYYSSVGANTAGYPVADSQACSAQGTACFWDTFDKNYALFAYVSALANGQNFAVNGTFYTEWKAVGDMGTLGPPVGAQTATNATTIFPPATVATTGTTQAFARGAIYSITNNGNRGKVFSVIGPIYDLYIAQAGPNGSLGMPTSEAFQVSGGVLRQNFEGGAIQAGGGSDPSILLPVTAVLLSGAQSGSTITLNVGQTLSLSATPMTVSGAAPDRAVTWTTTNGKVLSIDASGGTAVITATGSGAASVQAVSNGVASVKINFIVKAPCCQLGEGAPASVQQAFRDAVSRNRLTIDAILPSPAARAGAGYIQMVPASDSSAVYLLTQSDRLGTAYVVSGLLLSRYQALGGPAGALGYPAGDMSAGGTQLFANGALGGNPVRLVAAPILAKWALLQYENGAAGIPTSEATGFESFGANSGQQQSFANGVIFGASTGPRAGDAHLVAGPILSRYNALGGAGGDFGMPTSDEFVSAGVRQQNFEGGSITYAAGDAAAAEHASPRVPSILAFPASVSAGATARLAVLGFPNNANVRVSIAGSPDFVVASANGAYSWEMAIPLTAKSGSIAIHATDGQNTADGSLTVRGFGDNRIQIAKVQGDNQSGPPGTLLPLSLRVALLDAAKTPVVGAAVVFDASPGAQLSAASTTTDENGMAEVFVRLPAAARAALVTANSPSIAQAPVTFRLIASAAALANFPRLPQPAGLSGQKGALVTAAASILQYHQNRGELGAPNGLADPAALNTFLSNFCVVDTKGAQVCDGYLSSGPGAEQVANLWRAADFTGGVDVQVRKPVVAAAADLVAQGSPALLSLGLTRNGTASGAHFVVATGVADDGSLTIQDPSPTLARTSLADYLNGFNSGGVSWKGELRGVVQFALRPPSPTRFLVTAYSAAAAIDVQSAAGPCGQALEVAGVARLVECDGADAVYQVSVAGAPASLTDLATAGSRFDLGANSYRVTRQKLNVILGPQTPSFTADAVVNAATFTTGIAPGGIVAIFGSGLSGAGQSTAVDVDGAPANVVFASPFQVNAVLPVDLAPGSHTVRVRSGFGSAQQTVSVDVVAPRIFLIGTPPVGAVVNQDNRLNGPSAPLDRGKTLVIYATGLGAVATLGDLSISTTPVTVVMNGRELPVSFAGLTPGFPGLYQVNVTIPAAIPPSLDATLALKQGDRTSNAVQVSVQ